MALQLPQGQSQASKTVFIAGAAMFAIVLANAVKHPGRSGEGSTYKQLWAVGVLTMFLAAAADFAPGVIVPFSVAIVVAFAIRNPDALGGILAGSGSGGGSSRSGKAVARKGGGSIATVTGPNSHVGGGPAL